MIRARSRALVLAVVAAAGFALFTISARHASGSKPKLLLLTSLPIVFGEDFSLEQPPSPVMTELNAHYRVIPISVTDPPELAKGGLLLMAYPLAQTPENLVALDGWVRRGGRLLLLADPMLEWPSRRPLGDPLRPPAMFMDTGLLGHWGLRLDAPDKRGPRASALGGEQVMTVSPGQLFGSCEVSRDRLVARCRVGKGEATVVADADLLDVDDLGSAGRRNLKGLLAELGKLAQQ